MNNFFKKLNLLLLFLRGWVGGGSGQKLTVLESWSSTLAATNRKLLASVHCRPQTPYVLTYLLSTLRKM